MYFFLYFGFCLVYSEDYIGYIESLVYLIYYFGFYLVASGNYSGDLEALADLIDWMIECLIPNNLRDVFKPVSIHENAYNYKYAADLNFSNFMLNLRKIYK